MKIAIMGIRGLPAKYGGFETFAEELAPRLVKKSHHVTVYGRLWRRYLIGNTVFLLLVLKEVFKRRIFRRDGYVSFKK